MAFDRIPTRAAPPTSIAMPASAPCHLAGQSSDIVCALVTLDGSYYAAMRSRGNMGAEAVADSEGDVYGSPSVKVATDD